MLLSCSLKYFAWCCCSLYCIHCCWCRAVSCTIAPKDTLATLALACCTMSNRRATVVTICEQFLKLRIINSSTKQKIGTVSNPCIF
ncbi:hypothetical protein PF008_g10796 [Phytophthora fragariae]|uniref:Secreted protein n=1 Tax=Phytophthora fragariae TaxID=53985 RepID=A0A6G0RU87_9STRA|nr:hypothetical protein PF008_g10796 [Phytophthora fragariae]